MSYKLDSRWSSRGLKKCPKCGTPNGHRAAQCKNKQCNESLGGGTAASAGRNRDVFLAVRIKSGARDPSVQLYSVRRLNGTKVVRGFVEIHEYLERGGDQLMQHKTGVCHVDRSPHTGPEGTCQHVRAAADSLEVAEGLGIERKYLDMLGFAVEEREAIWRRQLNCGERDLLVQKVAADTFVVKCEDELQRPVQYCHVQLKQPSSITCDCRMLTSCEKITCSHTYIVAAAVLSSPEYRPVFESMLKHLIVGPQCSESTIEINNTVPFLDNMILLPDNTNPFVSYPSLETADQFLVTTIEDPPTITSDTDIQLIDCPLEFESNFPNIDITEPASGTVSTSPIIELINSTESTTISAEEAFCSTGFDSDNLQLMDCQIELMDQFNLTDRIDFCPSDIELSDDNLVFPADEELGLAVDAILPANDSPPQSPVKKKPKLIKITAKKGALKQTSKIAKEKMKKGSYNVRRLMKILESNGVVFNRIKRSEAMVLATSDGEGGVATTNGSLPSYEATLCGLTFTNWLESVIEQV